MRGGHLEEMVRKSAKAQKAEGLHLLQTGPRFVPSSFGEDGQAVGRIVGRGGLDFIGDLRGRFVTFDCKSTKTRSSFPLDNVEGHQATIIRNCHKRGAVGFFLVELAPTIGDPAYFALTWPVFERFWMPFHYGTDDDDAPASVPRAVLEAECLAIARKGKTLDLVTTIRALLEQAA